MIVINTAIVNYHTKEQSQEPNAVDIKSQSDDPNSIQNTESSDKAKDSSDKSVDNIEDGHVSGSVVEDNTESGITNAQQQVEQYDSSKPIVIINIDRTN